MTTVITRLFASEKTARSVTNRLHRERFSSRSYSVITEGDADSSAALVDRLERAQVDPAAAAAYAKHLTGDAALLLISVTYKPLGAAQIARGILAEYETIDVGTVPEDIYMPDGPEPAQSVLKEHPRFLTLTPDPDDPPRGPVTSGFMKLLSPHRTKRSVISGERRMSRMFWPKPLVSHKRSATSAISGGAHMSRKFWPQDLLSRKPRRNSVIRGGSLPFARLFGWPSISQR